MQRYSRLKYMPLGWKQSRAIRDAGIKSGKALKGHINAQHKGEVDPNCPACAEIQRKQNQ